MKFGIFVFGDNHPELGRSNQKYYQEVLTMAEWAEELGFDSFWLGEHHLYWYGTCVSPPMIIAALGQRTKRIRLGPAVAVPSFHNPLIVAEEYALADNLCNGRLEFALGSGFTLGGRCLRFGGGFGSRLGRRFGRLRRFRRWFSSGRFGGRLGRACLRGGLRRRLACLGGLAACLLWR